MGQKFTEILKPRAHMLLRSNPIFSSVQLTKPQIALERITIFKNVFLNTQAINLLPLPYVHLLFIIHEISSFHIQSSSPPLPHPINPTIYCPPILQPPSTPPSSPFPNSLLITKRFDTIELSISQEGN